MYVCRYVCMLYVCIDVSVAYECVSHRVLLNLVWTIGAMRRYDRYLRYDQGCIFGSVQILCFFASCRTSYPTQPVWSVQETPHYL